MNCIAKHKCTASQKLNTRRRGEKLNATSHGSSLILSGVCLTVVSRARTYIVYLCILWFILCEARKASENRLCYLNIWVLKCSRFVFVFIIFSRCRKWAILRRWLVHVRWFPCSLRDRLFSVRINGEARSIIVLACQVGPGTSRSLR